MTHVQSDDSATLMRVDPLSQAARVTPYNSDGLELNPPPVGIYMLPINVRFSAILTAALVSLVWSMRGASTSRDIRVRRVHIRSGFDGTEAATSLELLLTKITTATPTAGNALTPIELQSAFAATDVTDARQSTGAALLTVASVAVDTNGHIAALMQPRRNGSNSELALDFYDPNDPYSGLQLATGEGLALKIATNTVVGDVISGFVEWEER